MLLKIVTVIITLCNEQPNQSHSKLRRWKSMLIHQGWFTLLYTQHLPDSQSFEFEICILQALNMPLIRCTNVFFQGRLSRHITSPSEKSRPETWPGDYMGKAAPFWRLSSSYRATNPSKATANPVGGKACSSTKGGLLRYILNTYPIHKVSSLKFAYYKHSICR